MHVKVHVTGKVQGVGLRPYILLLAKQLNLYGYASNLVCGLDIFLYGEKQNIESFQIQLLRKAPKHAKIATLTAINLPEPAKAYQAFEIKHQPLAATRLASQTVDTAPFIPADRALCKTCLSELFDPKNRRYLHPFISCIECGPRASIILQMPYDRANTSFNYFKECMNCAQESTQYIEQQTQRFHGQNNACWQCGPTLKLFQKNKDVITNTDKKTDYFGQLASTIRAGKIIAMKGMSGFHLLCDAKNTAAITKLRAFKHRPEKPFALMSLNTNSLEHLVQLDQLDQLDQPQCNELESDAAPIVLLPKRSMSDAISELLAPKLNDLGCMLPYTPMHYLLFHALLDAPRDASWLSDKQDLFLAVTSANLPGEPLITSNQQCIDTMADIADLVLTHNRDIHLGCDDSVIQLDDANSKNSRVIRRARGFAPEPIQLPFSGKAVLALGAHQKNTFCLSDGKRAFLSPHLGEPKSIASYAHFEAVLDHYLKLYAIKPELVACDNHPDFFSSQYAKDYAQKHNLPLIEVPHHQAHIASVLAEMSLEDNFSFIGLALDGIGLGESEHTSPRALWGGELFLGKLSTDANNRKQLSLHHQAQISALSLPGGDKATKQIGRIGFALLNDVSKVNLPKHQHDFSLSSELQEFIKTHTPTFPSTSALGRWFDAISAILCIRQEVSYEGQAAMELEACAKRYGNLPASKHLASIDKHGNLSLYPVLPAVLAAESAPEAAAIFHAELADGLVRWILSKTKSHKTQHIVCSGGCFQNKLLRSALAKGATANGLRLHYPKQVPVNDAGISLGQAFIASLH